MFDDFHKDCNRSNGIKIVDNKTSINEEIEGKVELVQFASGLRKIIEITSDCKSGESLERLNFYPMLIKPINRLVYARVGETRISFVTDRINGENIPLRIEGVSYLPQVSFSENDFNINVNLIEEYGTRNKLSFKFKFDGEFLTAENSCAENSLMEKLENVIFQTFTCQTPFLRTCKAPGDFFPFHFSFYQNLKITIQTTTNNFKVLICNY